MVLVPAILIVLAVLSGGIAAGRYEFPHVRMTQRWLASIVEEAAGRSPTLASLLHRLQDSDVVVFVQTSTTLAGRITGRTFLVNATPLVRYLRSEVRAEAPETDIVVAIAHELQHAVEIAADGARDNRGIERLFRQIGHQHATGYETRSAQDVGLRVRQELARRPPDLRAAAPPPRPMGASSRCGIS